jgi:hypothetical protein
MKKPWLSKTLIVNTVTALLAITGQTEKVGLSSDSLLVILSALNLVLRMVTKDKIGLDA